MGEEMTRREFLQKSGAAAAAVGIGMAAAQATANAAAPSEKILIGVIGCGGMGMGRMHQAMDNPSVEVVAVCDVDDNHSARAAQDVERKYGRRPKVFRDFRRVLEMKDVDAVIVATPDHWHALPTVLACQAGKDVFVEKPISHNIVEGRTMVNAARKYNRVVQVGTQQRSEGPFYSAVHTIKSGKLGKITHVHILFHENSAPHGLGRPPDSNPPPNVDYDLWLGPAPKRPFNPLRFHGQWRWFFDYGSGKIGDWGIHHVDIVHWAMDPKDGAGIAPVTAASTGGKFVLDDIRDTPDTQEAVFKYPAIGDQPPWVLTISVRWCNGRGVDGRNYGIFFYGTEGTLYVDRGGMEIWPEHDRKIEPEPNKNWSHMNNWLECIKTRKKPVADIEYGHKATVVPHLANISLKVGRSIRWDPVKEQCIGDKEANQLLFREYRAPWKLPKV
ncbi:MAG: Gfo/Idh/MocA family protein [Armatimonadota bacterium]